jgi:hypothetical protein
VRGVFELAPPQDSSSDISHMTRARYRVTKLNAEHVARAAPVSARKRTIDDASASERQSGNEGHNLL